jgi:hypothetical protein
MSASSADISGIAHAIQLALTPVFLLTGIAGLLNVMTGRLARIIDRGRRLTEGPKLDTSARPALQLELVDLERRRRLTSWAINACTLGALLVCTVVASIFLEALLELHLPWLVGILFTGAMLALIVGLTAFLREVHLATQTVRIPVSRIDS